MAFTFRTEDGSVPTPGPRVIAAVGLFYVLLLAAKIYAALTLRLFGDEAFYWQCAQRLALAYLDLPPVTALLVLAGTSVFGDSPLGVRAAFLLIGAALPFAFAWMAYPVIGRAAAWWGAALTLVMVGTAGLGFVAGPDAPMVLLHILFLGALVRAVEHDHWRYWTLLGLVCAAGFLVHYRFVLYPLAALLWSVLTEQGRAQWRRGGLWLALLLALPGLVPIVWVNLWGDFASIGFFAGRHGGNADTGEALQFIGEQLAYVTPLLFAALVAVLVALLRRARRGDRAAALFGCFGATYFAVFMLASPFESTGLMRNHWMVSGYIPLLVFLPGMLMAFAARSRARRMLAWLTPGLGAAVVVLALLELSTGVFGSQLRRPFLGWQEAAAVARIELDALEAAGHARLLVADGYKLGASLEFELGGDVELYVLDHPRNRKHGRALQYPVWSMAEDDVWLRAGEPAVIAVFASQPPRGAALAWMAHVAGFFDDFEAVTEVRVAVRGMPDVPLRFGYYRGVVSHSRPDD